MPHSKEIETLEALEEILGLLAKKEAQLLELGKEIEQVKAENERLRAESGQSRLQHEKETQTNSSFDALNRTVLIIDHVKMFRVNLASILNANGYEVVGECHPEESTIIETLLKKAPLIVTIDYHMPDLSCENIIKLIKEKAPDVKVVVISEELSYDSIYTMLKAGASDFVTKPVQPTRLLTVLKGLYPL
ncbi:response regulator [bacterium]|nr:response regulator [bacterium]